MAIGSTTTQLRKVLAVAAAFGAIAAALVLISLSRKSTDTSPIAEHPAPVQVAMYGTASFKSDNGDFIGAGKSWKSTDAAGKFSAYIDAKGALSISFQGDDWWSFSFAAPEGQRLALGQYDDARRAGFHSPMKPGIEISGAGRGCNTLNGSFAVRRIEYSAKGDAIKSFAAEFEQHCESAVAALRGTIDLTSQNGFADRR